MAGGTIEDRVMHVEHDHGIRWSHADKREANKRSRSQIERPTSNVFLNVVKAGLRLPGPRKIKDMQDRNHVVMDYL